MADEEDPIIIQGIPDWLVTFGDMMSLLLTFFILLFSVSELKDPSKLFDLTTSFQGKTKTTPVEAYLLPRIDPMADGLLYRHMENPGGLGAAGASTDPSSRPEGSESHDPAASRWREFRVIGTVEFEKKQTLLRKRSLDFLDHEVLPSCRNLSHRIYIVGHTSPDEATTPREHQLLAYERALAVHVHLLHRGIEPRRLVIFSAGSHDPPPLDPGSAEKLRPERVELCIP